MLDLIGAIKSAKKTYEALETSSLKSCSICVRYAYAKRIFSKAQNISDVYWSIEFAPNTVDVVRLKTNNFFKLSKVKRQIQASSNTPISFTDEDRHEAFYTIDEARKRRSRRRKRNTS